jgi:hypothetical protein
MERAGELPVGTLQRRDVEREALRQPEDREGVHRAIKR